MNRTNPPVLRSLIPTLEKVPADDLPWIVQKHVKYLDDKIHEIDVLTDYLASCTQVESERVEFVEFVLDWTRRDSPDLDEYATEYARRFHAVRAVVEKQCDRVLDDKSIWSRREGIIRFWQEFAYMNEVDSLHGMFLTSGRWHVNVMLPMVKELVASWLPGSIDTNRRNEWAYKMARRIITPRYADSEAAYDPKLEKQFIAVLVPILQHFDRKLLFLFDMMAKLSIPDFRTLSDFVNDVVQNPARYSPLLKIGVYPPFAWHELHSSRKPRRLAPEYQEAVRPLLSAVSETNLPRAQSALEKLALLKSYEVNYNNYNYKGRFGIVSKLFYLRTLSHLPGEVHETFLDAILGDRFFEALAIVENSV